jgi:exodeoxyribonuclease VII small subunit
MVTKKNTAQKFETSLKELEEIVKELENSQIDLDDHLKLYEKGVRLIQSCQQSLKEAEQKILLLSGMDATGEPVLQKFKHESTEGKEQHGLFPVNLIDKACLIAIISQVL